MQKWEHLVVYTNGTRVTHVQGTPPSLPFPFVWEFLDQRGDEGWELVGSNLMGAKLSGVNPAEGVLYMKREK